MSPVAGVFRWPLAVEHRRPLGLRLTFQAAGAVLRSRQTVLLGMALTALMASFTSYLASAERSSTRRSTSLTPSCR